MILLIRRHTHLELYWGERGGGNKIRIQDPNLIYKEGESDSFLLLCFNGVGFLLSPSHPNSKLTASPCCSSSTFQFFFFSYSKIKIYLKLNWTVNWFPQFPISLSAPRHPHSTPLPLPLPTVFQIFFRGWKLGSVNFLSPDSAILVLIRVFIYLVFFWPVTIKPKPISPLVFQEDHHSVSVSSLPPFSLKTPSSYTTFHLFLLLLLLFVKFSSLCLSSCSPNWHFCFLIPYLILGSSN